MKIISEIIDPAMCGCGSYEISPEVADLTGLTQEMIESYGTHLGDILGQVRDMGQVASFMVAHNAVRFDAVVLNRHNRGNDEFVGPWIDTMTDIKYPKSITTRKLTHLAAEHGFINPFPHRAVFDVMTMFKVMSCYDLDDVIARSKEPMVYLQALVEFKDKDKARLRGYRWNSDRKIWWQGFKSSDASVEVESCGFNTQQLVGCPE